MSADRQSETVKFKASSPGYDERKTSGVGEQGMIEQTAVVVEAERGYAWIIPQKQAGSCSNCSGKTCSATSPFDFFRSKTPCKIQVLNPINARSGDRVVVGMQGDALLLYSFLAYFFPLLGLLLAAWLGREMFALMSLGSEAGAVLGGIAGLLGGLRFANTVSARSLQSDRFQPVILRIQGQASYRSIIPFS